MLEESHFFLVGPFRGVLRALCGKQRGWDWTYCRTSLLARAGGLEGRRDERKGKAGVSRLVESVWDPQHWDQSLLFHNVSPPCPFRGPVLPINGSRVSQPSVSGTWKVLVHPTLYHYKNRKCHLEWHRWLWGTLSCWVGSLDWETGHPDPVPGPPNHVTITSLWTSVLHTQIIVLFCKWVWVLNYKIQYL